MNNVNYYYYPPTNHPFPAFNNNCGSWYFILGGKGREGKGSIGIGYKRNENYCLKTVKTCRKLIRQKSKSYCRHSLLGIF